MSAPGIGDDVGFEDFGYARSVKKQVLIKVVLINAVLFGGALAYYKVDAIKAFAKGKFTRFFGGAQAGDGLIVKPVGITHELPAPSGFGQQAGNWGWQVNG